MDKKIRLSIFLSLLSLLCFSQSYTTEIKISQYTSGKSIAYLEDYIYVDISKSLYFDKYRETSYIFKLDRALNTLDSVNLNALVNPSQLATVWTGDIKVIDSTLAVSIYYIDTIINNCSPVKIGLLFFDDALNLVDQIYFNPGPNQYILPFFDYDSVSFVFSGTTYNCDSNDYSPTIAYFNRTDSTFKVKNLGESISNTFAQEVTRHSIIDNKIYCRVWPPASPNFSDNIILDRDLNVLHQGSILEPFSQDLKTLHRHGKFIKTNNKIVQIGLSRSYPDSLFLPSTLFGYWNLAFTEIDSLGNITTVDTLPLSGYDFQTSKDITGQHQFGFDAIDYNVLDSVLIIQGEKAVFTYNFDSQDTTPFYIYNLNLNTKSVNWVRKVTRPYTNGNHSIAALPGNRSAIAFNEYNWDDYSGENLAVHIWILDANGSIISQREFKAPTNPISLFPNPCSDYLQVTLAKDQKWPLAYSVFNAKGDRVAKGQINGKQNTIDTRQLPAGQYILNLEGLGSAKFLKK